MASKSDSNVAAKAADVVNEQLDKDSVGAKNYIQKALGQENARKGEHASGFIGTGDAKDAVEKAKQSS